ncbi:hypothetical protein DYB31_011552 [Aphanomyces astaci]|uniref:Secreted protein n=1 Tax=Aphanomyces astaci TaxID=112090 RepID=A0A397FHF5_APHAT|nr:hypothetical protein DYB31_011552 [Aphanomyces astaci]
MLRCASVVLAVAASVAIAQTPPDASTCLPWDATVEKAIHPSLTDLYKALSPLAVMSPGFGSCLRNGQEGWILLVQSIASNDDCNQTIKWLQAKPMSDIPFQHANRTQAQAMALATHLLHLNDTQLLSTCTNTIPAVAACVMNKHVSNVFCSTQVVAGAKTSCGMTSVKAVIPSSVDMVDMLTRLADFLVAPNDQGCPAQEGLPFNDTAGSPRSPLFHNATPFSGCSASLDAFVQWIKSVPYLRLISTFDPSRLFANGSAMCVTGQKLLPYLELFLPQDKPAAMALITDFYANKCMHIANGFAASCKFRWPATEYYVASNWPYETTNSATATSAPSSVPAKSPASVPSSSAAAASALGWTASMIVLTAMM